MLTAFHHRLIAQLSQLGCDADALTTAMTDAYANSTPWTDAVINAQLVSPKPLGDTMAMLLNMPLVDLDRHDTRDAGTLIDPKLIARHRALPLSKDNSTLTLAMSDPTDRDAIQSIRFHTHLNVTPVLVEADKLSRHLDKLSLGVPVVLDEHLDDEDIEDDPIVDAPTVQFVQKILADAVQLGASDIHFEPYENSFRVRYRIDGVMSSVNTPPKSQAGKITTRLKVMAHLDIAERRKPQDGRIKFRLSEHKSVDFRVSTLPTLFGEKIVLRILDSAQTLIGMDALGLNATQKQQFTDALHKPQGMILITGPTGSGKTISLYTALGLLNRGDNNILTAEDPVEINLDGINQTNINPKIGLDFADLLRAFLRQDPDVIMVGEIRDTETAEIAIKAAQTGHLVLSTLHTNSAAATLTRLGSMGVPSFQLASGVNLIIAQRLARRLCDDCKRAVVLPPQVLREAGFGDDDISRTHQLYEPAGCHRCRDGYRGRVGIFELLPITPNIRKLIFDRADSDVIDHANRQAGNISLRQSGIAAVMAGITSLTEMHRATSD